MKRFLYDALLILILLLVGMSLDDSTVYENKQEELNKFDKKIEKQEKIEKKEGTTVMNQIDENKASNAAKDASEMVSGVIRGSVNFVKEIFDSITDV